MDLRDRDFILRLVDRCVKMNNDWPGAPIGHLPIVVSPTLNAMVKAGEVTILERPAKVDPKQKRAFVVRTS